MKCGNTKALYIVTNACVTLALYIVTNACVTQFRVSPLGVVPKKAPGEYRLIHHLSFPHGASVNDGISTENSFVQYARVDDAVTMIKQLGRGCFLAKTDIKSAFRIIPTIIDKKNRDTPKNRQHSSQSTINTDIYPYSPSPNTMLLH